MSPNTMPTAIRRPIAESPFREADDEVGRLVVVFISINVANTMMLNSNNTGVQLVFCGIARRFIWKVAIFVIRLTIETIIRNESKKRECKISGLPDADGICGYSIVGIYS